MEVGAGIQGSPNMLTLFDSAWNPLHLNEDRATNVLQDGESLP
jgi:hypothetical protein